MSFQSFVTKILVYSWHQLVRMTLPFPYGNHFIMFWMMNDFKKIIKGFAKGIDSPLRPTLHLLKN
jgi:hypothetical protein